jgi:hypothetical protein
VPGLSVHGSDVEKRIIPVDHVGLVTLPELRFPFLAVLSSPLPVRFAHFPIRARDFVAGALLVITVKLVPERKRDFLQFFFRFLKK